MLYLLGKCSCINQKQSFPSLRHSLVSMTLLETAVVLFCTFNPVASCSGSCLCQTGLFLHELSVRVAKYASMRHTVQMANNSCLQPGRKSICHCFIIGPHCVAFRQTHSSRQVPKCWCLPGILHKSHLLTCKLSLCSFQHCSLFLLQGCLERLEVSSLFAGDV